MGRAGNDREEQVKAASLCMARAQEAIAAAELARSDDAVAAFYKEAETWLYMAGRCLNPHSGSRPEPLPLPARRVSGERRSFSEE